MDLPKSMPAPRPIRIAAIGDVHDQWEAEDCVALQHLNVDLALFVGDFGNESVDIVQSIASLDLPKAVILGNHDAWYSASDWGKKRCPYDRTLEDRVQEQLDLLGSDHVGYGTLNLPHLNLSIVGGRPFSWGGSEWKNVKFYRDRYGICNFDQSTQRIVKAASNATCDTLIFLGHCGPKGLGAEPEDPCGKDWQPLGGDHGDPDLADAIAKTRLLGKPMPLVVFGHMHHRLRHTRERLRQIVCRDNQDTVYYNAASVPRIIDRDGERLRNFSLITLEQSQVAKASLVWVNRQFAIASEEILYQQPIASPASAVGS